MLIRLFCAGGTSTSILARKIREAATSRGLDAEVTFGGVHHLQRMDPAELKQADVALLGPQVGFERAYLEDKCQEAGVPLAVIPMRDYGMCDGEAVLNLALDLMGRSDDE